MAANHDELLHRIEETMSAWGGDVSDVQAALTHRISAASERLAFLREQLGGAAAPAPESTRSGVPDLIAERENSLREAIERNEALTEEAAAAHEQNRLLAARSNDMEVENLHLREDSESFRARASTLDQQYQTVCTELEALENRLVESEARHEADQAEMAAARAEIAASRATIEDMETSAEALRQEAREAFARAEESEVCLRQLRIERDTIQNELDSARRESDSNLAIIRGLREDLSQDNNRSQRLTDKLNAAEDRQSALESELASLRQERSELLNELQQLQETHQSGLAEVETLKRRMRDQESALTMAREKLRSQQQIGDEQRKAIEQLEEEVVRAQREARDSFESGQTLARAFDEFRTEAADKERKLYQAQNDLLTMRRESQRRESEREAADDALATAHARLAEFESERDRVNRELAQARQQLSERDTYEGALRDELNALSEQVDSQARALQTAEEFKSGAEARVAGLERELAEKTALIEQAEGPEGVPALREQLDALRQREADARVRIHEDQLHIRDLEDAVADRESLERQNRELSEQVAALKADVARLERHAAPLDNRGRPVNDHSTAEEVETLRQELLTFETMLMERERAVQDAAEKMQRMDETRQKVHADLVSLREAYEAKEHDAQHEISALRRELRDLREALVERERLHVEQRKQLAAKEDTLRELQEDLESILEQQETAARETAAPESIEEANERLQTLQAALLEREATVEKLRNLEPRAGRNRIIFSAYDVDGRKRSIGEMLLSAGIINKQQLENALAEQQSAPKRRLGSILVEKGFIREEMVAQVLASQLQLPFVRLEEEQLQPDALALLNGRLATHHRCIPIRRTGTAITIAMSNPFDLIAVEDLEFATHREVKPVVATLTDIRAAIVTYYGVETLDPQAVPGGAQGRPATSAFQPLRGNDEGPADQHRQSA